MVMVELVVKHEVVARILSVAIKAIVVSNRVIVSTL